MQMRRVMFKVRVMMVVFIVMVMFKVTLETISPALLKSNRQSREGGDCPNGNPPL